MERFIYLKGKNGRIRAEGDSQVGLGGERGVFAEWDWDGQRLLACNDRYGFYPLYYAEGEDSLAVSPSIQKLLNLGFSAELDEDALAVFLRLGWFIGEDTAFRAIRALPPGASLVWRDGRMELSSGGIIIGETKKFSRTEAIERYAALFDRAVEKCLSDDERKTAVPLSGGRDSRHILLALNKLGRKPDACLTVLHPPPRPDEDVRVASEVCLTVGVEHIPVNQTGTRFRNEIRKNELTGLTVFEHGWYLSLADFIREGWDEIYDGIAGDVLSAGLFLDEERLELYRAGKLETLADRIMEKEAYLPALLKAGVYQRLSRDRAIERLTIELERHSSAPNPVGSFFFWNRTRRCIAVSPFRLIGETVRINAPYLDDELFDFLISLPAETFLDHRFHTETIAAAYPEFAGLGYEKKEAGEVKDAGHFKKYGRDILRFALTRRKKTLTNRRFLLSRCLRGTFDPAYSRNVIDFGELAIMLMQLERF
ncbi:MAG: hypothetical protein R2747_16845 [Pyrinomonadaceae bacterium]